EGGQQERTRHEFHRCHAASGLGFPVKPSKNGQKWLKVGHFRSVFVFFGLFEGKFYRISAVFRVFTGSKALER
ncbi:MAG: hypothetical protein Q4C25_09755, partial [Bacillota bacterium]|nr:hypothetical protein [Bacillota bacterium]